MCFTKKNKGNKLIIVNIYSSDGGPLVLSVLCSVLRKLGYDVSMYITAGATLDNKKPKIETLIKQIIISVLILITRSRVIRKLLRKTLKTSILIDGCKYKIVPFFNKDKTVVLYPDVIFGNPLKAKMVIRWLLYFNRYTNSAQYSKDDLFIAYRKKFNDITLNPEENIVKIGYFNKNLYRRYNYSERKGNCYLLRKGKNRPDIPKEFDGPVFDNNMSDEKWVEILNQCKYCYSYDTQTFYNYIAAICGCIPIVMMEQNKSIDDYIGPEDDHYGIAFGNTDDQIKYAIDTRKILESKLDYTQKNIENAEFLVKLIKQKFGSLTKL